MKIKLYGINDSTQVHDLKITISIKGTTLVLRKFNQVTQEIDSFSLDLQTLKKYNRYTIGVERIYNDLHIVQADYSAENKLELIKTMRFIRDNNIPHLYIFTDNDYCYVMVSKSSFDGFFFDDSDCELGDTQITKVSFEEYINYPSITTIFANAEDKQSLSKFIECRDALEDAVVALDNLKNAPTDYSPVQLDIMLKVLNFILVKTNLKETLRKEDVDLAVLLEICNNVNICDIMTKENLEEELNTKVNRYTCIDKLNSFK